MKRLAVLTIGIAVAAAILVHLAGDPLRRSVASGPPQDEIDDASRARLDQLIRDAGDAP